MKITYPATDTKPEVVIRAKDARSVLRQLQNSESDPALRARPRPVTRYGKPVNVYGPLWAPVVVE